MMLHGLRPWLLAGILVPLFLLVITQLEGGVSTAPHAVVLLEPAPENWTGA